jgi:hypothetical protein
MGITHSYREAAVAGYLVLNIAGKEGLEMSGHCSDMWCGKEEP